MSKNSIYRVIAAIFLASLLIACSSQGNIEWEDSFKEGTHIVVEVETRGGPSIDKQNTVEILKILESRLEYLGIRESERVIKIAGNRKIIMQLPFVKYSPRIVKLMASMPQLKFKLVDDESPISAKLPHVISPDEEDALLKRFEGKLPDDREILFQEFKDKETGVVVEIPMLLKKQILLTGEFLTAVEIDSEHTHSSVFIKFNTTGTKRLKNITAQNVGKRLAIIYDGDIHTAPVIPKKISNGELVIGRISFEKAKELKLVLTAGAIPAPVQIIEATKLTKDLWQER